MEWHDEFKAYARAFGGDEVAAILLRKDGNEWIAWPAQNREGLTFTLTADAILSTVSADDLEHVVGWVHSHPRGLDPTPSGVDDVQIRQMAQDLAGSVVDMVIFGGHAYSSMSVTRAVLIDGEVFVSDTTTYTAHYASAWDDDARAFYDASRPALPAKPHRMAGDYLAGWGYVKARDEVGICVTCGKSDDDVLNDQCGACEWETEQRNWVAARETDIG